MKNYCFEGLLSVGTGKFNCLSAWIDDNHPDFPASCPKNFACIRFESQETSVKGLYRIFVDDCVSLADARRLLKNLLADYQLNFYSSCRYSCYSHNSAKLTSSVRYFKDGFFDED